jgi:hypothetical protein
MLLEISTQECRVTSPLSIYLCNFTFICVYFCFAMSIAVGRKEETEILLSIQRRNKVHQRLNDIIFSSNDSNLLPQKKEVKKEDEFVQ